MTFAELVPPTIPKLRNYARSLSHELCDDLVQDTLLRALLTWHTFDSSRALMPWLCTIMRNRFIDSRRTPQRWKVDAERASPQPEYGATVGLIEALNTLPFEQWEVLVLSEVYELTSLEIAAKLELPEGTVRSRKRYALATLRQRLRVT